MNMLKSHQRDQSEGSGQRLRLRQAPWCLSCSLSVFLSLSPSLSLSLSLSLPLSFSLSLSTPLLSPSLSLFLSFSQTGGPELDALCQYCVCNHLRHRTCHWTK